MTDVLATAGDFDQDVIDAQRLAEQLRRLRELRGAFDKATADLAAGREAGRKRIAALQAEVDAENAALAGVVHDAAVEFNAAAADLVETGFATPKVLAAKGLGTIRVNKK